jgi:hypothetical protein
MSDANDYLNPIFAQTKLMQDGEANIEKKQKDPTESQKIN